MSLRRPEAIDLKDDRRLMDVLTGVYDAIKALQVSSTTTYLSFIGAGRAGRGFVALTPVRMPDGSLRQANPGDAVWGVLDINANVDLQAFYEPSISEPNQILQASNINTAGGTILVLLVRN